MSLESTPLALVAGVNVIEYTSFNQEVGWSHANNPAPLFTVVSDGLYDVSFSLESTVIITGTTYNLTLDILVDAVVQRSMVVIDIPQINSSQAINIPSRLIQLNATQSLSTNVTISVTGGVVTSATAGVNTSLVVTRIA